MLLNSGVGEIDVTQYRARYRCSNVLGVFPWQNRFHTRHTSVECSLRRILTLRIRTVEHGGVGERSYSYTHTGSIHLRPQILLYICSTLQDTTLDLGRAIPRTLRQWYQHLRYTCCVIKEKKSTAYISCSIWAVVLY